MRKTADTAGTTLVPAVRYRDAPAAIDWLCTALGFRKHRIVADDGQLLHAHLTLGNAMIAVLPIRDTELDRLMKQPDEVGGAETQTCYLFVPDADEHYRAAKDAGAEILLDLDDDGHGGRGYVCRDLEGHIWNFGTYDPWGEDRPPRVRFSVSGIGSRPLVAIVILGVATAAAAGGWLFHGSEDARLNLELSAAHRSIEEAAAHATALERTDKGLAERAVREVREQLAHDQAAMLAVSRRVADELAAERRAKASAERLATDAEERFAKEKAAKDLVDRTSSEMVKELARERDGRRRAERAAKDALEQLSRERIAREAAEQAAKEALRKLGDTPSAKNEPPRPAAAAKGPPVQELSAKPAPARPPPMPRVVP